MRAQVPIPRTAAVEPAIRILRVPATGQYRLVVNSQQAQPPWGVSWFADSFAPQATVLNTPELVAEFGTPCKGSVPQTFYLQSGGKVGIGFNLHDNAGDIDLQILTSYLKDSSGVWVDQVFNVMKLQSMLFFNITITQGFDGLIYVLLDQDASDATPLIRFKETASGLELMDISTKISIQVGSTEIITYTYIPKTIGDKIARHGELPPMQLHQDKFRKILLATYPNNYGPPQPTSITGTQGSLTKIRPDLSKELLSVFDVLVWQYVPPLMAFVQQDFYGLAGLRLNQDYTKTWLLRKLDLNGGTLEESEKPWNHNSPWHEDGYVFYGDADGYWIERLYEQAAPGPIPPHPEPPQPEPGPIPPIPTPEPPHPEPGPPLTVAVNSDKRSYIKNQTAMIGVNCDQPDATVTVTFKFKNNSPAPFVLKTDANGVASMSIAIKPSYGKGNVMVGAAAEKTGFTPGFGTTSFRIT